MCPVTCSGLLRGSVLVSGLSSTILPYCFDLFTVSAYSGKRCFPLRVSGRFHSSYPFSLGASLYHSPPCRAFRCASSVLLGFNLAYVLRGVNSFLLSV